MEQYYRKPFIESALLRVFLFIICFLAVFLLFEGLGLLLMEDWFPNIDQRSPVFFTLSRTIETILLLLLLYIFRKKVDRRPFLTDWFAFTKRKMDLIVGFIAGAVLIAVASLILNQMGFVKFLPGHLTAAQGIQYVLLFFVGALFEELAFRGYIQDNLQEDFHPIIAIVITSALFMVLHLGNPNIETLPIVNLFLAGILLGVSFAFTRNLWFPLGLHWSWNVFQGPVFGFEVSGINFESLFHQEISDQSIWTGGEFGLEGSILATILICVASLIIYFQFNRFSKNENA